MGRRTRIRRGLTVGLLVGALALIGASCTSGGILSTQTAFAGNAGYSIHQDGVDIDSGFSAAVFTLTGTTGLGGGGPLGGGTRTYTMKPDDGFAGQTGKWKVVVTQNVAFEGHVTVTPPDGSYQLDGYGATFTTTDPACDARGTRTANFQASLSIDDHTTAYLDFDICDNGISQEDLD